MKVKVINGSDGLKSDDLLDIRGGIQDGVNEESECVCDCWIGNRNEAPEKPKPSDPSKPGPTEPIKSH